ncbi:mucin-5AC-like [Trematomus bernacchii]|uniref:mucin-5AC-like n=1 Tax=Trematomus bernacchii TaxID=40690 RepID=UPI00146CFB21|nr:mucin-5AC-like [Trematomus bernacchii]
MCQSSRPGPSHLREHYILLLPELLATVPRQQSSTATACRVSPMELPLGGPALRHYTQSRPRPHRQKLNYRPSRPQETIIESDNEVLELMGRVDEGVEEFFTKRVLPTDSPTKQEEELITVHEEVAPASSVPCPPPTKTLRRKLGDFFTLRKRRGLKSEPSQEGRPKKASIADLIRPLREVARAEKEKDKDRVKEHDKENEKEKGKETPSAVTGDAAVQETTGAPMRGETGPPRRALREGKSQSLILLSGSAAAGTTNARNTSKKQFEGQHSFEQKLHLMLQRIGVSKAQPEETQSPEGEMKKAESEGTIIDSKPEPPPTKPRTMSASSDTRHQIRPSVSAHESAGKPALLPKPVIRPGPPPTTSGRNTPENELAQIQEAETNTPTKQSPATAPALTTTTTPTAPTISNPVPDSNDSTSAEPPANTDTSTDSANPTAAATTPTNVTEHDSKTSIPEETTAEPPTSISKTTVTSTTPPAEPPATASVTSTSSESVIPSLSVTSTSTTITTLSMTTSETVSAPSNESSVSTTNLSTTSTSPSVDPAAGGDSAISVATTAYSPSTSTSDMPSGLSAKTNSVTEASDDSPSVTSCSVTLVSSDTKTTSPPPSDTITTAASPLASMTSSSLLISSPDPPPTISTSSTTTTSPTSTDCTNSSSIITNPATSDPADISVPSTSSSETNPTDTTSTATTLYRADTKPTSSSSAAAICSSPMTDSDPPNTNDGSSTLTPDNASDASQHLTSPGQDNDLQTPPEGRSSEEPAEKGTHGELEMVQKSKQTETEECKTVVHNGKEGENENQEPALNSDSEVIIKEVQKESVKPEEDTMKSKVEEPASGRDAELCSDKGEKEEEKQDEVGK